MMEPGKRREKVESVSRQRGQRLAESRTEEPEVERLPPRIGAEAE